MAKTSTNSTTPTVLPEDVAKQYDIADGVLAQFVCSEFGAIDLTRIDLDLAARLATKGYLKKKQV